MQHTATVFCCDSLGGSGDSTSLGETQNSPNEADDGAVRGLVNGALQSAMRFTVAVQCAALAATQATSNVLITLLTSLESGVTKTGAAVVAVHVSLRVSRVKLSHMCARRPWCDRAVELS